MWVLLSSRCRNIASAGDRRSGGMADSSNLACAERRPFRPDRLPACGREGSAANESYPLRMSEAHATRGGPGGRSASGQGSEEKADLDLPKKAERVLSEIDRTQGLLERHAHLPPALRVRI